LDKLLNSNCLYKIFTKFHEPQKAVDLLILFTKLEIAEIHDKTKYLVDLSSLTLLDKNDAIKLSVCLITNAYNTLDFKVKNSIFNAMSYIMFHTRTYRPRIRFCVLKVAESFCKCFTVKQWNALNKSKVEITDIESNESTDESYTDDEFYGYGLESEDDYGYGYGGYSS
jgi:hypothetical protein